MTHVNQFSETVNPFEHGLNRYRDPDRDGDSNVTQNEDVYAICCPGSVISGQHVPGHAG